MHIGDAIFEDPVLEEKKSPSLATMFKACPYASLCFLNA
jgi:hypothetical protein